MRSGLTGAPLEDLLRFIGEMRCASVAQIYALHFKPKYGFSLRRGQTLIAQLLDEGYVRRLPLLNARPILIGLKPKALNLARVAERVTTHESRKPTDHVVARAWLRAEYRVQALARGEHVGSTAKDYQGFVASLLSGVKSREQRHRLAKAMARPLAAVCPKCQGRFSLRIKKCPCCSLPLGSQFSGRRFGCSKCSYSSGVAEAKHPRSLSMQECAGTMIERSFTPYEIHRRGKRHTLVIFDEFNKSLERQIDSLPFVSSRQPAITYRFVETRSIAPFTLEAALATTKQRARAFHGIARKRFAHLLVQEELS